MKFFVVIACVLLSSRCGSLPVEESVVSVYTTLPTTAGTSPSLDVYHQIANNIAERITSPIYKFLGFNSTSTTTTAESTTKHPWGKIETLDEQDLSTRPDMKPVDNDIENRDVEELSVESLKKPEKKPEKFTLYSSLASSYLPAKLESNDTKNEVDSDFDSFELDDVDETEKPRGEGPLVFIMEFFGSLLQLLWGGISALFKS